MKHILSIKEVSSLEDLLKHLAQKKNQLYMFFRDGGGALTSEECFDRIKKKAQYEAVLEIIAMLPLDETNTFNEIERDLFPDAPYLAKFKAKGKCY